MRFRTRSLIPLILPLLAAISACKSPVSPMPAGPTLTLILPDSAREFDSLLFRAHYSDSVKPTWDYAWQFGDSTKASTRDTSITHVYDSAGTYTLQVALTDTTLHQTIAKQTALLNVMPLNAPTLTLNVPATGFWGDSCVMIVQSSLPLKSSWSYTWAFGDSTMLTSSQDTIQHYFLTPGTFTVRVALNDTMHHILLASKSATISVTARHFNLALLQSMKYVDVSWQAFFSSDTEPSPEAMANSCDYPPYGINIVLPLTWNKYGFSMNASNYSGNSNFETIIDSGSTDPNLTQLTSFFQDSNSSLNDTPYQCYSTYQNSMQINQIPFKSSTDSDMTFQSNGMISENGNYQLSIYSQGRVQYFTINSRAWWSPVPANSHFIPYIRIRFHN